MSEEVEKVKQYLRAWGLSERVREFTVSSATVELAARAVGVIPARIAKTLSFLKKEGDGCVLVVAAGDARIDNKKFKALFGMKAKMLTPEQVRDFTGHYIGGVCPFDLPQGRCEVWLDSSLRRFDTVYPAAGSDASAVELSCDELERCSQARGWVDVCRTPEQAEGGEG